MLLYIIIKGNWYVHFSIWYVHLLIIPIFHCKPPMASTYFSRICARRNSPALRFLNGKNRKKTHPKGDGHIDFLLDAC